MGDSSNTNDFTVATYNSTGGGLAYSYGTILNNHVGQLAVSPSASQPNFEFALTNFSKIPGFNPADGFYVSLFLGSQRAIVVGKETIPWTQIAGSSHVAREDFPRLVVRSRRRPRPRDSACLPPQSPNRRGSCSSRQGRPSRWQPSVSDRPESSRSEANRFPDDHAPVSGGRFEGSFELTAMA